MKTRVQKYSSMNLIHDMILNVKIIPVIDLLDEHVVRGVGGNRTQYQPIVSSLCASSKPQDVVSAFLELAPFDTVYIADLNALQNKGNSSAVIFALLDRFPNIEFWVDGGFTTTKSIRSYLGHVGFKPILATETITSIAQYEKLTEFLDPEAFVLSLDHKAGRLGLDHLFDQPKFWPNRVIVMSLDDVGSDSGPNIPLINDYQSLDPSKQYIAAGGVRDDRDIEKLAAHKVYAVLVASALHGGRLNCRRWIEPNRD